MSVINGKEFTVIVNNIKVTDSFTNSIHEIVQEQKLMHYWNKQGRFPSDQNNNIKWSGIKHAHETLILNHKILQRSGKLMYQHS